MMGKTNNSRIIRGYSILAKGIEPKVIDKETFLVPSQNSNKKYRVTHKDEWSCECSDFYYRKIECKHILAVKFWLKLKEKINSQDTLDLTQELDKPRCVYCGSEEIIKKDKRKNKSGVKQRYLCKKCNRKFVFDVVKKVKGNGKIVTLAMDLYYKGLSLRDISDTIYQFLGLRIHHETIRRWIIKFVKIMNSYVNQFKPKVSGAWHVDEQNIKVKGKWLWAWNLLDAETRFLIANAITENREISDARLVFQKAKEITKGRPEFIITDGLWSYEKAIKKEFPTWRLPRTEHIRLETIQEKPNNNLVERFHGTFRERDKVMRGFKAKYTAQILLEGFKTYYNFIKPHMSLEGLTPSQKAQIELQLDRNRWLSLLRKSLENNGNFKRPDVRQN